VQEASVQLAVDLLDSQGGFLPNSSGEALRLTEGFVFFGNSFENVPVEDIPPSVAFLTVASVLQAARDLANPAIQLRPTGYESVTLSTENFLRYNDNLLQACILRAALASELDYSSSAQHSRLMKEFLRKVFSRHAHPYGAAALEFAAALASGRLRLTNKDKDELIRSTLPSLEAAASPLLGLLLLVP
jgi:hypothetical protein